MKAFKRIIALLALLVSNSYAGKKVTIIEKINETEKIQVFFTESKITVKQPAVSAATALYPEEAEALKAKIEPIDLSEDYKTLYASVVTEINKAFGVEKFVMGDIDAVPKKTVKIFGTDTEVEDWNALSDKFIVYVSVDVKYYGSSYSRVDDKVKIETYMEASIVLRFCKIVEEKAPLSYLNPAGVNIYSKGEKFNQMGIFTTMEQFTEMAAPNSMVAVIEAKIPGSLDKFYKKQKKKYDKANK